jgi:hypothetical protein
MKQPHEIESVESVHFPAGARRTMLGREYRYRASVDHPEFKGSAPAKDKDAPMFTRIDGVKRLSWNGQFVFSKVYKARVGVREDGTPIHRLGKYVGNQRPLPNGEIEVGRLQGGGGVDESPRTGESWDIYLQMDPNDKTSVERWRLCELVPVGILGTVIAEANDYTPKRPTVRIVREPGVPPRPETGMKVTHPEHGGGEVVRVTGTGERWYASVEYPWSAGPLDPPAGTVVRCKVRRPGAEKGEKVQWTYGHVVTTRRRLVTVEFEGGRMETVRRSDFYRRFKLLREYPSSNFFETFGLKRPIVRPIYRTKKIGHDSRTHNQRLAYDSGATSTALSALNQKHTPEASEFVPVSTRGQHGEPLQRMHRKRPIPRGSDDFAPLVGRPPTRPRKRSNTAPASPSAASRSLHGHSEFRDMTESGSAVTGPEDQGWSSADDGDVKVRVVQVRCIKCKGRGAVTRKALVGMAESICVTCDGKGWKQEAIEVQRRWKREANDADAPQSDANSSATVRNGRVQIF